MGRDNRPAQHLGVASKADPECLAITFGDRFPAAETY